MRWLRRALVVLLGLAVVAAGIAGWLYWQTRQEPEFLEGAPTVDLLEAHRIVAALSTDAPSRVPSAGTPGPPTGAGQPPRRPPAPIPYRIVLGEREIGAVVVAKAPPELSRYVSNLRVRIRATDLVAAGTIRQAPLSGRTGWIDVRPSVGRRGQLCLRFGQLHVGRADIPEGLLERATGGRGIPPVQCVAHRGLLPGPLTNVEISGGRVVLRGVRR